MTGPIIFQWINITQENSTSNFFSLSTVLILPLSFILFIWTDKIQEKKKKTFITHFLCCIFQQSHTKSLAMQHLARSPAGKIIACIKQLNISPWQQKSSVTLKSLKAHASMKCIVWMKWGKKIRSGWIDKWTYLSLGWSMTKDKCIKDGNHPNLDTFAVPHIAGGIDDKQISGYSLTYKLRLFYVNIILCNPANELKKITSMVEFINQKSSEIKK